MNMSSQVFLLEIWCSNLVWFWGIFCPVLRNDYWTRRRLLPCFHTFTCMQLKLTILYKKTCTDVTLITFQTCSNFGWGDGTWQEYSPLCLLSSSTSSRLLAFRLCPQAWIHYCLECPPYEVTSTWKQVASVSGVNMIQTLRALNGEF